MQFIAQPNDEIRLGEFLIHSLRDPQWTEFRAAIAFVRQSGTRHIKVALSEFCNRGGVAKISVGVDLGGTTVEGLRDLIEIVPDGGLLVFKNANSSTFHPKVYLFKSAQNALVAIGSGNLTEGGLYTNYEAGVVLALDRQVPEQLELLRTIERALDEWSTPTEGLCYQLDNLFLDQLIAREDLPSEDIVRRARRAQAELNEEDGGGAVDVNRIFARINVRRAPNIPRVPNVLEQELAENDDAEFHDANAVEQDLEIVQPVPAPAQDGVHHVFLMTLQNTDVGVGQTTVGRQRRSPEIFIPLICRDFDPLFWGWPDLFTPDQNWNGPLDSQGRGKMDRTNIMIRLGADVFPATIWYNPQKKDVRIRSEHIRSAGNVGDILYLERSNGATGFSYYVEIIPQGTARHAGYLAQCNQSVRNSLKRWAYL